MKSGVIEIPELCVVAMIGTSGSGKSTFARKHFGPYEVLSSDAFRGWVSNDENSQESTNDAFDALHYLLAKRLSRGLLTVVDATNVRPEDRRPLVDMARRFHCFCVAIVLHVPERVCHERNQGRPDRDFGPHVVRRQAESLRKSLRYLEREGFRYVHIMGNEQEAASAVVRRTPSWNNRKQETGPFDLIGDLHGCADELEQLLARLGYEAREMNEADPLWGSRTYRHPQGRRAVFLGDLVDRGPRVLDSIRIVRNMTASGDAFCVAGNHDVKLVRWMHGKNVQVRHGLAQSIAELGPLDASGREKVAKFLDGLISHYVFDGGRLVTAHAGLREEMHGRTSGGVREFCLYGETTGETDEFGLPVRYNWAAEYRGKAMVVYGHTPVPEAEWLNNTINIDTGCVFGGGLTALRYPERELVTVPATRMYAEPARPIETPKGGRRAQQILDDVLDLGDVTGKRVIETAVFGPRTLTIREENSIAALEVMSRFATDPHWLIYLPPTMSPCETSRRAEYLEYPEEAFEFYKAAGIERVVCEEKHMGSRAIMVVCRDPEAARQRFGVIDGKAGVCYTRTGRPFFPDAGDEAAFVARVNAAVTRSRLWEALQTDWLCLDCELMPWSAKAVELLKRQYAAVGAAGNASLEAVNAALATAPESAAAVREEFAHRLKRVHKYREAYRRYCWPVRSLDDYKLAPFHVMASEGAVHMDKTNRWHMDHAHRLAAADPGFLVATPFLEVDLSDGESVAAACRWWEELTGKGGEGMVIKPLDFAAKGSKGGVTQPAIKCRGREYLRIIYGPEYTADDQLPRLRSRGLSGKRSLASREFTLGLEALSRFVGKEPLRRVHECVFGVLALESEPVDPRL